MDKNLLKFIVSMAVFGTIGIFRKFIPLDSGFIAMSRGLIGGLFIIVFLAIKGRPFKLSHLKGKWWKLLIIGGIMGFNWITLFEAYNYTTVSTATLCYYMQPVFLILLSPMLFKEEITAKKAVCVIAAFAGMVLVSGILADGISGMRDIRGILLALASGLLYAIVVSMSKLVKDCDPYEKTAVQLFGSAIAVFPYLLVKGVFSDPATAAGFTPISIIMLAIVCIVHTGIVYVMYFGSIDHIKMQQVAILGYLDPVISLILSALVLHENMGISGIIGAVLIIGAAIVSELWN